VPKTPGGRLARWTVLAAVIAVVVGAAVVVSSGADQDPPPLPARVDPLLPDLTIAPITEIFGGVNEDETRTLRFGVAIANIGAGDFVLRARRSNLITDDWHVVQRIPEASGGFTEVPTDATLVWGGDGHDHWHIREVESHTIETLDGEVLGRVVKNGFCFFDTDQLHPDLPGAPAAATYHSPGCGGRLDSTVRMGLSVGWGDDYPWHLFEQEIPITNLPEGVVYRVRAAADPFGWFDELDESNNEFTMEITWHIQDGAPYVEVVGAPSPLKSPSPGP